MGDVLKGCNLVDEREVREFRRKGFEQGRRRDGRTELFNQIEAEIESGGRHSLSGDGGVAGGGPPDLFKVIREDCEDGGYGMS